jgi:D-alanyl-D-alanine carboxypeptidase (penicillin-binding protein 5/6)
MAASHVSALETTAKQAVVIDHQTGIVLYEKEAHTPMYPASMTKMMTAYLMFDALKSGKLLLTDTYSVSENAWRKGGSKMFVQLHDNVAISDLMRGIIIQSGNDGCIVFAEGYAGTEERFAELMTEKAKEIGMKNSVFKNATGWPDDNHVTTAYDLAWLAKRTIDDFAEYYPVYSELEYVYHNIKQYNRNVLLHRNMGIDGLKTGHTEAAGYGITISGQQNGRRVHVVVNGLDSEKERAAEAAKLFRFAMTETKNITIGRPEKIIAQIPVWYGEATQVAAVTEEGAAVTLPALGEVNITAKVMYDVSLQAPITKGQRIGALSVKAGELAEQMLPLFAASDVKKAGLMDRMLVNAKALLLGN